MALLYGGLVLLVGVSLLFTSIVLLNRSISKLRFFQYDFGNLIYTPKANLSDPKTAAALKALAARNLGKPSALGDSARTAAAGYLYRTGLIFFGIVVVIGAVGGYLLAKQALRPIAQLTQTARALST